MAKFGNTAVPSIRRYRIRKGLTQQQLADQLEVDRATLGRLESATTRRRPGWQLARKIATLTKKTPGQILDEYERLRGAR